MLLGFDAGVALVEFIGGIKVFFFQIVVADEHFAGGVGCVAFFFERGYPAKQVFFVEIIYVVVDAHEFAEARGHAGLICSEHNGEGFGLAVAQLIIVLGTAAVITQAQGYHFTKELVFIYAYDVVFDFIVFDDEPFEVRKDWDGETGADFFWRVGGG